jgi:hypothetical protein
LGIQRRRLCPQHPWVSVFGRLVLEVATKRLDKYRPWFSLSLVLVRAMLGLSASPAPSGSLSCL